MVVGIDLDLHDRRSLNSRCPVAAGLVPKSTPAGAWRLPDRGIQHEAKTMTSNPKTDRTRDDLADGRNGRVVGENDDNPLESLGKAVIAPVEGADEGAEPVDGQHGRAFVDLTKTLPQGQKEVGTPQAPKPQGKAL
jgi:hypothetical protein